MTASKWLIAVNAGALMLVMAFVLFVLAQLRAVLKSLVRGNPFVPSNATRLRRIAFAVLLGEFDAWPSVDFTSLGSGLIILVIAEVFRAGTQLDEEQALTI